MKTLFLFLIVLLSSTFIKSTPSDEGVPVKQKSIIVTIAEEHPKQALSGAILLMGGGAGIAYNTPADLEALSKDIVTGSYLAAGAGFLWLILVIYWTYNKEKEKIKSEIWCNNTEREYVKIDSNAEPHSND